MKHLSHHHFRNRDKCSVKLKNFFQRPGATTPGYLLWHLTNVWQRFLKSKLEHVELTPVQFSILKGLKNTKKINITQGELAQEMEMNTMMVSEVVRTLEKRGLIQRVPHPSDTRAKCLVLSEKGNKLLSKAMELAIDAGIEFFGPIEKDLNQAVAIWSKLIEKNEKLLSE